MARILPEMMVTRLRGGQYGYGAHCISFPQDHCTLVNSLPRLPKDLDLVVIKKSGTNNCKEFKVWFIHKHLQRFSGFQKKSTCSAPLA